MTGNQGESLMKTFRLYVAGAAAMLPLAAAVAQSPPPAGQPPQGQGATFESLDKDADGRISKAEAEANAGVKAQFSSYDINGDGYIERAEVGQANGSQQRTPPPQQQPQQ
jgi:hypothetical protein